MPSYKNFQNQYRRSAEGDDLFKQPKRISMEQSLTDERRERLIHWITYYRRNVHRFVEHYFGIELYPYQKIWLYLMSISDTFVAICSRATGKSWLVGVYALAIAVLYPGSEIVIVASTKKQAGIIIDGKIVMLKDAHPNVAREIKRLVSNMNVRQVDFHNGSQIRVVPASDNSRGERSTFTIFEEFRLMEKNILDSVIRPFSYSRHTPYRMKREYKHLIEEARQVFISSAYHKGLWWFDETKKVIRDMLRGENSRFIALNYLLAIKHNIKTAKQIESEKSKMDEITALEEYDNIPWGESAFAYFKLKMFTRSRKIKQAFYPQRLETYNAKKNPYAIPRVEGEIRLVSCDIAQRAGKSNDLSITACIRLTPTRKGYYRELLHLESYSGVNSILQALRVKQLLYDFEGDVIVLDIATAGISIYDQLGILTNDPERGIEYPAMTVMDHPTLESSYAELAERTTGLNALPIIYPITGTSKLNSDIAVAMRDRLNKRMWGFLVDESNAEDYLIKSPYRSEFINQDVTAKSFFLAPYTQTSLLVNESVNLEMSMLSGHIKLSEIPGQRKDRYTSISYANYYAELLDRELIRDEDNSDEFEYISALVQAV